MYEPQHLNMHVLITFNNHQQPQANDSLHVADIDSIMLNYNSGPVHTQSDEVSQDPQKNVLRSCRLQVTFFHLLQWWHPAAAWLSPNGSQLLISTANYKRSRTSFCVL